MKDHEIIYFALNMWANHIETGDVSIGKSEMIKIGESSSCQELTDDQAEFVKKLRGMASGHFKKGLTVGQ